MAEDIKRSIPKPPPFKKKVRPSFLPPEPELKKGEEAYPVADATGEDSDTISIDRGKEAVEFSEEDILLEPKLQEEQKQDIYAEDFFIPTKTFDITEGISMPDTESAVEDKVQEVLPELESEKEIFSPVTSSSYKLQETMEDLESFGNDSVNIEKSSIEEGIISDEKISFSPIAEEEEPAEEEFKYIEPTEIQGTSFASGFSGIPFREDSLEKVYLPIKIKKEQKKEEACEFKAGLGKQVFYGKEGSIINLHIEGAREEWRLLVSSIKDEELLAEAGKIISLPSDADFIEGFVYDEKKDFVHLLPQDEITFPNDFGRWKMFYLSLKEVPLNSLSSYSLDGRNGMILGPKGSSLVFFNVDRLDILRKLHVPYKAAEYGIDMENFSATPSYFPFSIYSENTFFTGDDEVNTICLEVDEGDTYGWNVSFENGIFMSVADIVEYQNRNGFLPDSAGVLYHGANRLEFSEVKEILVYKKPFYYGYGVA